MRRKMIFRALTGSVFIAFVIALPSMSFAEIGVWTKKAYMPTPRYGFSASVVNGKIYAIGGRAGFQYLSTVEEYDPATDTWTRKADMPTLRHNLSAGVVNGKIYAMGGILTESSGLLGPSRIVEEYDPATDTWRRRADMPAERERFSASVVNGKIYAISGYKRGSPVTTVDEYDPATDIWRARADMPKARPLLSTSVVNDKIYAIGGSGWPDPPFSTVEEYDPEIDTWTRKADMPTARDSLSTSVVNGKIYAIGGESNETSYLSTVEVYDPVTDTWTPNEDMMPTARFSFGTSVVDGRIYAIGGRSGPWPQVTGAVEAYQPVPWAFAYAPNPSDGAMHPDTWATLSWGSGDLAVSHDVYFSDRFDDVSDGLGNTFRGNQAQTSLSAGFPGFPYPDGLVRGTTYYWRIDEVNDIDPNSPWKGDVWSFTIQPKKAYNPAPVDGAESVDLNVELSWTAGLGATLHTVYFGDHFDDVNNAAGGPSQASTTYAPGPLESGKTYYWRVDELSGGRLGEMHKGNIWNFTTPGAVGNPKPAYGATNVQLNVILSWTPADSAASHQLYFGTDKEAVRNADTSSPEYIGFRALGAENYDPGLLEADTTYYWRVDEIDDHGNVSTGPLWIFTTDSFFLVDDFEGYTDNDAAGEAIWQTWIDGLDVADNGAQVGNLMPPYCEQMIVHHGGQSMPLLYDNTAGVTNSEALLMLTNPRDWTRRSMTDLSLWFRGYPDSVGSFVEAPAGTFTMTGSGVNIWGTADQFQYAFKMLNGPGSIVAQVNSIENTNPWAKAGVMIRETLEAGSKHAFACVTPKNGVAFQGRTITNGTSFSTNETGITVPHWVKLERDTTGNFMVSHSANGTTWKPVANAVPMNIPMASNVYIGLSLTSHGAASACQAVFSNVTTSDTVSGQWAHQDVGIISNAAEPMYVALSSGNGMPAVVAHEDPAAVTIDTWTEWRIPLQTFADQGLNLTDVDGIAIGLGTKAGMTASGGSGTLYIDDIRLYRSEPQL